MFTLLLTAEKNITVETNEHLSLKVSQIGKREIVVFTTEDPLTETGGAMAFGVTADESFIPAIILSNTGFKNSEVRGSILFHELGHVVHNHIRKPAYELSDQERTMVEFEADSFMAKHLGKMAAINALSALSVSHPSRWAEIVIRITALVFGKWCWKFFKNSLHWGS